MSELELPREMTPQVLSRSALFQLISQVSSPIEAAPKRLSGPKRWNPYRQRTSIFRQIIDTLNENEG